MFRYMITLSAFVCGVLFSTFFATAQSPLIKSSTFLGGDGNDHAWDVCIDLKTGNIIVAGFTSSTKFDLVDKVIQHGENLGGESYIFIALLDPTLSECLHFALLGGNGLDRALSLLLDSDGNIVIGGHTGSAEDFPTTKESAIQSEYGGGSLDAFITVLSPNLENIIYSTFLGGSDEDSLSSMVLGDEGEIYVTGFTLSTDFPVVDGAYQEEKKSSEDIFVCSLRRNLDSVKQLEYSTFIGGHGIEVNGKRDIWINHAVRFLNPVVAFEGDRTVILAGLTNSADFPITNGAYQTRLGGNRDGYIVRLLCDASRSPKEQLRYSTYLGGGGMDCLNAIGIDPSGDVIVAGFSWSGNYPITLGAFQIFLGGQDDVIVSRIRLDPTLSSSEQLRYSTKMGGASWDYAASMAILPSGTVTIAGSMNWQGFPVRPQAEVGLIDDRAAFVAQIKPDRHLSHEKQVHYSIPLSGMGADSVFGLALTESGDAVVVGETNSFDLPTTEGAFQEEYLSAIDAFITHVYLPDYSVCLNMQPESAVGVAPFVIHFDASCSTGNEELRIASYNWNFGDRSEESQGPEATHVYTSAGVYVMTLAVTFENGLSFTAERLVKVFCPSGDITPWKSEDLGQPGWPGGSFMEEECLTVCTVARGISSGPARMTDEIRFVYKEIEGDFSLSVKVEEVVATSESSQIGLMFRENLTRGSRQAAMLLRDVGEDFQSEFWSRTVTDGFCNNTSGMKLGLPAWLKLTRRGDEFIGYVSSTAESDAWTEVGRNTLSGIDTILVGIAAAGKTSNLSDPDLEFMTATVCVEEQAFEILRGDFNGDGEVNISDASYLLNWLFNGGPDLPCLAAGDANGDGDTNISDASYLLNFLFLGGPSPVEPFPDCGPLAEDEKLGCVTPPADCQ